MTDWRLLHSEAVSGELLGELPLISVDATETLNGTGRWSASLPLDDVAQLTPGSTVVYLDRDGVILATGIVWTASADYGAGVLNVAGEGLGSYYRKRLITFYGSYTGVEQTSIAAAVQGTADSLDGIGVTAVPVATG
ncbi:MAG: hypothetical protein AB7H19_13870, partial [Porticoccaceae bacterium]